MVGYTNAGSTLTDWNNPSVCAIACDVGGTGASTSAGPYGATYTRVVLYQDGSAKAQGSSALNATTVGAANGDTGGTTGTDLRMLQTN